MTRWLLSAVPYLVLLLALALKAADPPFIEQARNLIFDSYQRMKPRDFDAAQSPVAIVDVDDESLSKLGQWPWPRPLLAKLVAKLHAAGAATVAFDVVFAEPDRSSPENVLPLWPKSPEIDAVRAHLADLPRHDAEFAKVLAESRAVTAFVLSTDEVGRKPAVKTGFAVAGDDPSPFLYGFKNAIVNLPELEAAALGNGAVNWLPSRDQVIRRVPTIFRIGTEKYPTLFVEALRVAQDAKTIIIKSSGASGEASFGESTGIVSIKVGAFVIPTDANGQVVAYFNKSSPARYVSAWRVLEPDFKPERIDGKIVLFGTSAKGLFDLRTTPLDPAIPGVEVHAQIIEQVVTKAFLSRPDFAPAVELLYVLLLGLILILIVPRVGAVWAGFVGMAGIAAAVYGGWYAFASNLKFLLDGVYAGAALLVVFMSATLVVYLRTAREREQVRGAFSRYMSPVLVEQLADHPEKLTLGGEMRDMTIMFSDIRGFTAISEKFDAHGLTNFINRYLTPMTDIILTERGTIDKYMGDAIMAFWNAPLEDKQHAANACNAALAMMRTLKQLNVTWEAEARAANREYVPVKAGVGLNTGVCCVGNMGSAQRFDYSVLGDDVNLASRLEGQSKTYGVAIVVGEETMRQASHYAYLELDLIRVKGKTKPVRIFALVGDETVAAAPPFLEHKARHDAMLAAYRAQDWKTARAGLHALIAQPAGWFKEMVEANALYGLYRARIERFEAAPPPAPWDGVYEAETK